MIEITTNNDLIDLHTSNVSLGSNILDVVDLKPHLHVYLRWRSPQLTIAQHGDLIRKQIFSNILELYYTSYFKSQIVRDSLFLTKQNEVIYYQMSSGIYFKLEYTLEEYKSELSRLISEFNEIVDFKQDKHCSLIQDFVKSKEMVRD